MMQLSFAQFISSCIQYHKIHKKTCNCPSPPPPAKKNTLKTPLQCLKFLMLVWIKWANILCEIITLGIAVIISCYRTFFELHLFLEQIMVRWFVSVTFKCQDKFLRCYHSNGTACAELLHSFIGQEFMKILGFLVIFFYFAHCYG